MEGINWTIVIAAASLEIVLITTACGVVWKLSRSEVALRSEFEEKFRSLSDKVYQVEIWARDEFVRKGSFELVIGRMEKSIEKIGDKIDAKFDELTKRIHSKT
ncbi:hypothetical protein HAP41_0000033330 [Bradyrhizobium barranii subsp. apii]|uniref:Uncharacterized protein n=1 Tax=Bradyrhizobium barranii subsp. apii TaxID=2819348 RepID=A0A8T5V3S0_9BRAD|nr:hypothetical protein [Bradyrhizobium barranii]UPT85173.1 hypothetical protein HAP41_0000033330 [Bradyrhizobium barranii subsp. apii]